MPVIGYTQNWEALYNNAVSNHKINKLQIALDYVTQALTQAEKEFGRKSENFILTYKELTLILKDGLGDKDTLYGKALKNLAEFYQEIGKYKEAEVNYTASIKIFKESFGEKNYYYVNSVSNLATLYCTMGQYKKSEFYYTEIIGIIKEMLGENSPDYASALNNFAEVYLISGQYENAEQLLLDATRIRLEVLGKENKDYSSSLNNLASLYVNLGQFEKAEKLFQEALSIDKTVLGENNFEYAQTLSNLAAYYYHMNRYDKAEQLLLDAKEIKKNTVGEKHPSYAQTLNNLAAVYTELEIYEKAGIFIKETIKIKKELLGEKHPDYALSVGNLGKLYLKSGSYEKAEPYLKEALRITKEIFGIKHINYGNSLYELAWLNNEMGLYEKAEPFFIEAQENFLEQLHKNFRFMSENQKLFFLKSVNTRFEFFYSFAVMRSKNNPDIIKKMLDVRLESKGVILNSLVQMYGRIKNSGDDDLLKKYYELVSLKETIISTQDLTIDERKKSGINADEYEAKTEEIEKSLNKETGTENTKKTTWADIKNSLKQNEAAVEFVDFRLYNKKWTDSVLYCAVVLKKDFQQPKLIELCREKDLRGILTVPPEKTDGYVRSNITSKDLYRLIFKPLENELKGTAKVFMSLTGLVNRISLNSLTTESDEIVIDKYNLIYVTNLKDIIMNQEENKMHKDNFYASVFGGADYDLDSASLISNAEKYKIYYENRGAKHELSDENRKYYNNSRMVTGGKWAYLKGTQEEAEKIYNIFINSGIKADLYKNGEATETALKSLSNSKQKISPTVLHIATHGFFFPDITGEKTGIDLKQNIGKRNILRISENPLRRSGLIFAGANRFWQGGYAITGVDDGILTAEEVSTMDLLNTELVVLSACETGLGDIKDAEGVYGLQRAFKVAGAKTIIMSLWKVPDKETMELMEIFYTNWLGGMSKHDAFLSAQKELRKKYLSYYWAAFVMIE